MKDKACKDVKDIEPYIQIERFNNGSLLLKKKQTKETLSHI